MAVVGMTEEEREGAEEEGGETETRSEGTSPEEGGEDMRGALWDAGGEGSIVGGMLVGGKVEEAAMTV